MVGAVDLVEVDGGHSLRDIVVDASGREHWERILAAIEAVDGRRGDRHDRPHLPAARRRQDRTAQQAPAEDPRRPLDGLHARASRASAWRSPTTRTRPSSTRSSATPSRSSPTARRCSAWATSARRAAMPVMEGKCCCSRSSPASTPSRSAWTRRTPTRSSRTVKLIAPAFGGINLEDISAPRCFEIEERLKQRAGHPRVPRRPARHGGGRDGGAAERREADRQAPGGPERAGHRPRRGRHRRHEDPAAAPACTQIIGADSRGVLHVRREDYLDGIDERRQALVRRGHQPRVPRGRAGRRDRRRRPVDRRLRRARAAGRGAGADEQRRDGLRDGQPEPGGQARGGGAVRADHGDRPLGLPEPDQQRAVLPRHLPRRAGRARAARSPRR